MSDWYLEVNGKAAGPFSWEELRFLATQRKIAAGDRVRPGLNSDWTAAESIRGLLAETVSANAAAPAWAMAAVAGQSAPLTPRPTPAPQTGAAEPHRPSLPPGRPAVAPPPLRARTPYDTRRRLVIAAVAGTALLSCLLAMLLIGVLFRYATTALRNGKAADGGLVAAESPAASRDGEGWDSDNGVESEAARQDPPLEQPPAGTGQNENSQPADPPSEEPSALSPSSGGPAADAGSSDQKPTEPPRPPLAAVIMPLDDEASPDDPNAVNASRVGGSAEFFEIVGTGRRFAYVVDCSGSMSGAPFSKACAELQRSIDQLNSGQSFFVVFFDHAEYPQFYPEISPGLVRASAENKHRLREWIAAFPLPGGGTDPSAALLRALSLEPDAIYLLSDGVFPAETAALVRAKNRKQCAIHAVAFMTREAETLLKNIARQNRGTYRFVP